MKGTYGERDYGFGTTMLTLRTAIGLTQMELAKRVGVSRWAVGEWEAGSSYPKVEHLKEVITLAVKSQAFSAGNAAEEIRMLWNASHQKVLLNELWLSSLLTNVKVFPRVGQIWPLASPVPMDSPPIPLHPMGKPWSVDTGIGR